MNFAFRTIENIFQRAFSSIHRMIVGYIFIIIASKNDKVSKFIKMIYDYALYPTIMRSHFQLILSENVRYCHKSLINY